MRTSVFIITSIVLAGQAILAAPGYGQGNEKKLISLDFKNASIQQVFSAIEAKADVVIMYENTGSLKNEKISISIKDKKVADVLDLLLKNKSLKWNIRENIIRVEAKFPSTLDASLLSGVLTDNLNSLLAPIKISGIITGVNNQPLNGASIKVEGKEIASISNETGYFEITTDPNTVLIISYIGYKEKRITVTQPGMLSIKLELSVSTLDTTEVSLSTGYQIYHKDRATGSFVFVDNKTLNRGVSTDIVSRLKGVTPSVLFDQTLEDNAYKNPGIAIRGKSTILSNTTPLIILDNFPYEGNVNNIDPNDIESMTILRDAAAASIWGVRSSNGVVVITTKKGKFNQNAVTEFNSIITVGDVPNIHANRQFIRSSDFIDVEKRLYDQNFYLLDLLNIFGTYQPISPAVLIYDKLKKGQISQQDADNSINALKQIDYRDNLEKYFYRKKVTQQYALNFSGGGNKSSYYLSVGYNKSLENIVGSNNDRFTLTATNKLSPFKNLEITNTINYVNSNGTTDNTYQNLTVGGATRSYAIYPYMQLADSYGNPLQVLKTYSDGYVKQTQGQGFLDWSFKPLAELNNGYNQTLAKINDIRISSSLRYTIIPGLSIDISNLYERSNFQSTNTSPVESFYTRNLINKYSVLTSGKVTAYNIPLGAIYRGQTETGKFYTIRGTANYSKSFNNNSLSVVAGIEQRQGQIESNNLTLYGFDVNTGIYSNVNAATTFTKLNPTGSGTIPTGNRVLGTVDRYRSFFGNASFDLNEKIVFSLSGRIDQSNLFGVKTNQKSVPLWSTGVSWNIKNERFYNISWLPELRARLTYGWNGNINKTLTAYTTLNVNPTEDLFGLTHPYATVISPGNEELRWERTAQINAGIDFSLVKNIVSGSIDFFTKNGKDLIGDELVPNSTGFNQVRGNFAELTGKGVDIILNSRVFDKSFKWYVTFSYGNATDKVKKYSGKSTSIAIVEGRPINGIYGIPWAGLDPQTGNPQGYIDQKVSTDYGTLNSLPLDKRVFKGSAVPTNYGFLTNTFSYKEFSLSFNITYKFGYYFRRSSINYSSLVNSWVGDIDYYARWQKPGDEARTQIPSFPTSVSSPREDFYGNSEVLLVKGDHIRLSDIRVSYGFNKNLLRNIKLNSLNVFLTVNNIGLLYKANNQGIDPDFQTGVVTPRLYSFGTKIMF